MPSELAALIEQRAEKWKGQLDCLSVSGGSLLDQARGLQNKDAESLLDLGRIPDAESLQPHLKFMIGFNPFLAEPLLREGSLLLDRCLQERREYDELKTKFFEACVQIQELIELNLITKQEEETYETSLIIATLELNALQKEQAGISEAIQLLRENPDGLLFVHPPDPKGATVLEGLTETLKTQATESADILAWLGNPARSHTKHPKSKKIPATLASTYAGSSEEIRGRKELSALRTQLAQLEGTNASLLEKIAVATRQKTLKEEQIKFQTKRNDVARFVALRRAEQLALPDGALNYQKRMASIRERLKNDLVAAWLRSSAAAKGFEMLYDYNAFDGDSGLFSREDNKKDYHNRKFNFDELVTWSQVTNTWLASFLDTQQHVTRSFSLRQLLDEQGGNFDNGLPAGKWRFKLQENHFSKSKLVRLRALAVQIDSGHFEGNWNVAISPPSKAILRVDESKTKTIQQGHIGTLYLGRVNETTFQVMPESAAPPKIHNASPIGEDNLSGEWGIEILGMSTNEKPVSSINDIDIHLSVALV